MEKKPLIGYTEAELKALCKELGISDRTLYRRLNDIGPLNMEQ